MKQKAKRLSAFILTAAIILSLTACSGDNTSVSEGNISSGISENNTSSDTSKPQNNTAVENTGNKVDDTLPQCEPANIGAYHVGSVMKGDSGYYYNDGWQIKYGVFSGGIVYFDNATGKTIPLCSKPQCLHDGNAFCPSTSFDSSFNILYNGYIYRLGEVINNENETIYAIHPSNKIYQVGKIKDFADNLEANVY